MILLNGSLYTVNNKDWSGASVSKVALDGSTSNTVNIAVASTGCGTSALRDDHIVYQIMGESVLNEFEATLMNNVGPITGFDQNYYELAQNPIDGKLYSSVTDYSTYGKIVIYEGNNEVKNFDAGVSPGTIVFDVRALSNLQETLANSVSVFPNPMSDELNVRVSSKADVQITDLAGKSLLVISVQPGSEVINVDSIPKGTYVCKLSFEDGSQHIRKITKN
jgi:hypothetical protein